MSVGTMINKIEIIRDEDWVEVIVDGDVAHSNHSFNTYDFIRFLKDYMPDVKIIEREVGRDDEF